MLKRKIRTLHVPVRWRHAISPSKWYDVHCDSKFGCYIINNIGGMLFVDLSGDDTAGIEWHTVAMYPLVGDFRPTPMEIFNSCIAVVLIVLMALPLL